MDNFRSLQLTDLYRNGCIKPEDYFIGATVWSIDETLEFSVEYKISNGNSPESLFLLLKHKQNKGTVFYRVGLVSLPTNTGRGKRWYFVCPFTGNRCTKLFYFNGYFRSRRSLESLSYLIGKANQPETLFNNAYSINALSKPNKEVKKWAGVFEASETESRTEIPFGFFYSQKLKVEKMFQ